MGRGAFAKLITVIPKHQEPDAPFLGWLMRGWGDTSVDLAPELAGRLGLERTPRAEQRI